MGLNYRFCGCHFVLWLTSISALSRNFVGCCSGYCICRHCSLDWVNFSFKLFIRKLETKLVCKAQAINKTGLLLPFYYFFLFLSLSLGSQFTALAIKKFTSERKTDLKSNWRFFSIIVRLTPTKFPYSNIYKKNSNLKYLGLIQHQVVFMTTVKWDLKHWHFIYKQYCWICLFGLDVKQHTDCKEVSSSLQCVRLMSFDITNLLSHDFSWDW